MEEILRVSSQLSALGQGWHLSFPSQSTSFLVWFQVTAPKIHKMALPAQIKHLQLWMWRKLFAMSHPKQYPQRNWILFHVCADQVLWSLFASCIVFGYLIEIEENPVQNYCFYFQQHLDGKVSKTPQWESQLNVQASHFPTILQIDNFMFNILYSMPQLFPVVYLTFKLSCFKPLSWISF